LQGTVRDPFGRWSSDELIRIGTSKPMVFAPGTNWGYSHTNYVILGRVIEKVTGLPLAAALQHYIMTPMKLAQTRSIATPEIPPPVLHTFSSERRDDLGIAASVPFYEETTYWNPSWTTGEGAVQVTDLADWTRSMELIGSGALIAKSSFATALGPQLVGFGHAQTGCSACRAMTTGFNYGLGVVNIGPWTIQNKSFAGCDASVGYLRKRRIAVSVVATYAPAAFDAHGNVVYATQKLFAELAGVMAPGSLPAPR
jgi:CubicO group peptidase (beta-lactamase class C family)